MQRLRYTSGSLLLSWALLYAATAETAAGQDWDTAAKTPNTASGIIFGNHVVCVLAVARWQGKEGASHAFGRWFVPEGNIPTHNG